MASKWYYFLVDSQSVDNKFIKMKFFLLALALVAGVVADVSELGYDYAPPAQAPEYHPVPVPEYHPAPVRTYIPPAPVHRPAPVHHPAPVPEYQPEYHPAPAPVKTYIPPAPVFHPVPIYHPAPAPEYHPAPVSTYLPPSTGGLVDDGYRYRSVRRRVHRRRS